jgi:hypothetical protein
MKMTIGRAVLFRLLYASRVLLVKLDSTYWVAKHVVDNNNCFDDIEFEALARLVDKFGDSIEVTENGHPVNFKPQ